MKNIINVLRFIIYLPLCISLLYLINWAIGLLALLLLKLSVIWLLLISLFGMAIIVGISMYLFGFLAAMLSYLNPYKKVGPWIVIPIAFINAIISIVLMWKIFDLKESNQLITALILSSLIIYITFAFSFFISSSNPKNLLSDINNQYN
ncbi:MAG: hypothetical protein WCH34_07225 [Bacteroidota bacterium]